MPRTTIIWSHRCDMIGKRVQPNERGEYPYSDLRSGDYFIWSGAWYGVSPNGLLCGLKNHTVVEHDDGTITVSPSILVNNGQGGVAWHGFLKAGVWEEC